MITDLYPKYITITYNAIIKEQINQFKKGAKYLHRQGSKEGIQRAQDKCPRSLAITEMQVKPPITQQSTTTRIVTMREIVTKKC